MLLDLCLRCYVLGVGAMEYSNVVAWWKAKDRVESFAANKLQAAFRGNAAREKVRSEGGIVTKALAGKHFAHALYKPSTPLERRCQIVVKDIAQKVQAGYGYRKIQTFHQIRSQMSQSHVIFEEIKQLYMQYDADGSGEIEVTEAINLLRDLGAQIGSDEMEYLFIEAFAPTETDKPLTVSKDKQRDKRQQAVKGGGSATTNAKNPKQKGGSENTQEGPGVGERVLLSHEVIRRNVNDIVSTGSIGPEEVGWVLETDPTSNRLQCLVKNVHKGSDRFGKTAWYRRTDLEPDETEKERVVTQLLPKEEIAAAKAAHTPAQLSELMARGLNFEHFLVLISIAFLLGVLEHPSDQQEAKAKSEAEVAAEAASTAADEAEAAAAIAMKAADEVKAALELSEVKTAEAKAKKKEAAAQEAKAMARAAEAEAKALAAVAATVSKLVRCCRLLDACIDAWMNIDVKALGVLVLDEIEPILTAAKAPPLITKQKLRAAAENQTSFIGFAQFLTGFLHWIDPEEDGI